MKVSLNWLKRYVDIDVPAEVLCDKMTMSGFEVEEMEDLSKTMDNVVAGRVVAMEHHPDADKLWVCQVDVSCSECGGKGCRICKGTGWIEILGAGMVHPNVLRGCGIDPDVYSGFAFGIGIDRLTTTRYRVSDIRLLFENDSRFLRQFQGR